MFVFRSNLEIKRASLLVKNVNWLLQPIEEISVFPFVFNLCTRLKTAAEYFIGEPEEELGDQKKKKKKSKELVASAPSTTT